MAYGQKAMTGHYKAMEGSLMDRIENHMYELRRKSVTVSQSLQKSGIPHAVIGGLAVGAYLARKDPSLVRTTKDLDILLREVDLVRVSVALQPHGFKYRKVLGIPAFIPMGGKFRDGVHVVFAGKKVRETDLMSAPELNDKLLTLSADQVVYLDLVNLMRMKLTSFRLKDRAHVQDFLEAGLITPKVEASLPSNLKARLEEVKDETERERLG